MPRIRINDVLTDDYDPDLGRMSYKKKRKKRTQHAILDEIVQHSSIQILGAEEAFNPTLGSSRWEREWIINYLGQLYDTQYITDVLRRVKGGKEANVYVCKAHPSTGTPLLAAKLYRPRMVRNLRNDARYRANRSLLDEYGKVIRDGGVMRAVRKGTSYGKEISHTSWLKHEFSTLQLLYDANLPVPQPVTSNDNIILMEYIGDLDLPAPNLTETTLSIKEARDTFDHLLDAIDHMLRLGRIHADLSAYNVLYWERRPYIIDFPQAVAPDENPEAWDIFKRDVIRICEHFRRYHIAANPRQLAKKMWMNYRADPDTPPVDEWVDDEE